MFENSIQWGLAQPNITPIDRSITSPNIDLSNNAIFQGLVRRQQNEEKQNFLDSMNRNALATRDAYNRVAEAYDRLGSAITNNNDKLVEAINNRSNPQQPSSTVTSQVNLGTGTNGFGTGKYSDGYKITRPTDGLKREYAPLQLQDPAHTKFALDEAAKYGLDPKWVTGLIMAESSGRMLKPNEASAMGYMQVTPGVGQMYTKATGQKVNLMDPYDNIKVGMWDMDRLHKMYKGDIALASAAYNAGEGRVNKWISGERELPLETQQYVPRLFSYAGMI